MHACVDDFSRMVIYAFYANNNRAETVLNYSRVVSENMVYLLGCDQTTALKMLPWHDTCWSKEVKDKEAFSLENQCTL